MSFFNNPIVICSLIALGIVLVLVLVIVICCKRNSAREREELMEISQEIENNFNDEVVSAEDSKIEDVLSKMQEAIESKEDSSISFEEEQEENAIISYQELLASLGAKSSIDVDSIQVFEDELDNQIEISDFNKEIIDAYQSENYDSEVYMFQNDYSSQEMPMELPKEEMPVMNFDFSNTELVSDEEISFDDSSSSNAEILGFNDNSSDVEISFNDTVDSVSSLDDTVYEAKHVVGNHKFKKTEFISPIYGVIDNASKSKTEEVEKIDFDDDDSLLDNF